MSRSRVTPASIRYDVALDIEARSMPPPQQQQGPRREPETQADMADTPHPPTAECPRPTPAEEAAWIAGVAARMGMPPDIEWDLVRFNRDRNTGEQASEEAETPAS